MKYIVLKEGIRKLPIIFPDTFNHIDVARMFKDMEPISAGFIDLFPNIVCHGHSETLRLKPHEDDETLIKTFSYHQGVYDPCMIRVAEILQSGGTNDKKANHGLSTSTCD